jgi:hypothetical protein
MRLTHSPQAVNLAGIGLSGHRNYSRKALFLRNILLHRFDFAVSPSKSSIKLACVPVSFAASNLSEQCGAQLPQNPSAAH